MSQYNVQFQDGNGQLAGLRNQLINGNMLFWQRGDGPFSSTQYTTDRWILVTNGSSQVSRAVVTAPGVPTVGPANGISITNGGTIRQMIELSKIGVNGQFKVGTQFTLSWYQTSGSTRAVATSSFREAGLTNSSQDTANNTVGSYTSIPSVLNGFDRYQVVFDINQTPNSPCTGLAVDLTFSDTAATVVTLVQFEAGPVATSFEEIPAGLELSLCERYYQQSGRLRAFVLARSNGSASDGPGYGQYTFPVEMRAAPTCSFQGTFSSSGGGSGNPIFTDVNRKTVRVGGSSTMSIGDVNWIDGNVDSDLIFDAEL